MQSGVRWHPDEYRICDVWNGAIVSRKVGEKEFEIWTKPLQESPMNLVWSHDGNKIAYNRTATNGAGQSAKQIFIIDF